MSYNLLQPVLEIAAGNMASTITSAALEIKLQDNLGIQCNFTGSPVGTFQIQISMDYMQDIFGTILNAGNWIPITLTYLSGGSFVSATSVPTSVGSPIYIDCNQLSAPYARIVYTAISGSGTLNAYVTAKGV